MSLVVGRVVVVVVRRGALVVGFAAGRVGGAAFRGGVGAGLVVGEDLPFDGAAFCGVAYAGAVNRASPSDVASAPRKSRRTVESHLCIVIAASLNVDQYQSLIIVLCPESSVAAMKRRNTAEKGRGGIRTHE